MSTQPLPPFGFQFEALTERELADQALTTRSHLEGTMSHLQKINGTSRAYAMGYQDYLPAGFAMESFSAHVSKDNYEMSLESLGFAIRLVTALAVVGALGVVAYKLLTLSQKKVATYNERKFKAIYALAKVESAVLDRFAHVGGFEMQAAKLAREQFGAQGTDSAVLRTLTDVILRRTLKERGSNRLVAKMLGGKFLSLAPFLKSHGQDLTRYFDHVANQFVGKTVDEMIEVGADGNLDTFAATLKANRVTEALPLPESGLDSWMKYYGGAFVPGTQTQDWVRAELLAQANDDDLKAVSLVSFSDKAIPSSREYEDLAKTQDKFKTSADQIKKHSERLRKADKVPTGLTDMFLTAVNEVGVLVDDVTFFYTYAGLEAQAIEEATMVMELSAKAYLSLLDTAASSLPTEDQAQVRKALREEIAKVKK